MSLTERINLEFQESWREWVEKIPYIPFKPEWEVAVIPPFSGALVRFRVRLKADKNASVSVYLDVADNLGYMGKPYWEIYPYFEDTCRFLLDEIDDLVLKIDESLQQQASEGAPHGQEEG